MTLLPSKSNDETDNENGNNTNYCYLHFFNVCPGHIKRLNTLLSKISNLTINDKLKCPNNCCHSTVSLLSCYMDGI